MTNFTDFNFLKQLGTDLDYLAEMEGLAKVYKVRVSVQTLNVEYLIDPPYARVIFNGFAYVVSTTAGMFAVEDAQEFMQYLEAATYLAMHLNGSLENAMDRYEG